MTRSGPSGEVPGCRLPEASARLLESVADDIFETHPECQINSGVFVLDFPLIQRLVKFLDQHFSAVVVVRIQIQMQHGMRYSFLLQLLNRKPFEKVLPAAEVGMNRAHQQALAETLRAGEK